ncbi:MAG: type II toxin-antitoxin system VapC family toxin, partial [Spirochaetota bacterium]
LVFRASAGIRTRGVGVTILLDTHVLLWWWSEPHHLSARLVALLKDPANEVVVSAASAWEIATKHRIGKYPAGARIIVEWHDRLARDGFRDLPIACAHALRAGSLPGPHRDPFDRMLAAQGIMEGLPVASNDRALSELGAERVWE